MKPTVTSFQVFGSWDPLPQRLSPPWATGLWKAGMPGRCVAEIPFLFKMQIVQPLGLSAYGQCPKKRIANRASHLMVCSQGSFFVVQK